MPKAFCCKDEPAYPRGPKWAAHLNAKPKPPEAEADAIGRPVVLRARPALIVVKERVSSLFRNRNKKK